MECVHATELLLAVDPAELQHDASGALAAHLQSCASCRARADLILSEQARLDRALTALSGARQRTSRPASRRYLPRLVLPLTAAAALALIVWQGARRGTGELPPILLPATRIAEVPVVNARADRNVAVMRATDPNITVVWYY